MTTAMLSSKACKRTLGPVVTARRWNTNSHKNKVLAIRREDASIWERRAPLSPSNVRYLVNKNFKVLVQPSNRRAYPMQSYANAGASIQEDISDAQVIFGVKQVPVDLLLPYRTYCFFSHTIKAQEANMALLDAILEKNIRLVDYEKMVDSNGQRVVAFGTWAGVAGMINIMHGLGLRLLALGHHTPFMHIGPAHNYRNSGMARQAIRDAGYEIALGMMPRSIGPLTFVFTGSGNVAQGAQEMFSELPHEYVPPEMLKKVAEHGATNKLYACAVSRADHFVRKDGGPFDALEFDEHPERYYSTFSKTVAPYASVIVNGIYWSVNSPKLITIPDAKNLLRPASTPWIASSSGCPALPHRLLAICDISADPGGSIEFMTECTTIDNPFCLYDANQHRNTESFAGPGVLVCSIDNMPTQMPRESTDFFGDLLLPQVEDILQSDAHKPLEEHRFTSIVEGAIITSNGKLTPNFKYIETLRNSNRLKKIGVEKGDGKKVLLLGAGYVSGPTVEYLSRSDGISIVVASALKEEADKLAARFRNTESILLDVSERPDTLEDLIKDVDLVISLLPYALHAVVAEQCIKHKVNMVTASYLTPQMKDMNKAAQLAGVTILNEVGLDPGIDHLLAMECFDEVKRNGGKVLSFVSYCGGLPAPEVSDNPLRYKFNWNPRGVLLNAMNSAVYRKDGKLVEIGGGGQLLDTALAVDFFPGFNLEGFANRDSEQYSAIYGIEEAHTVLRGTLRYKGFCEAVKSLIPLDLLSQKSHPILHPKGPDISWKQVLCSVLGQVDPNIFLDNLKGLVFERIGKSERGLETIIGLGLLSEDPIEKRDTPLDTLANYLQKRLAYGPSERDVVVLRHNVEIQWPDAKKELRSISLVCYGEPNGYSAMAKTVGYPAGIAAKMILDEEIQKKGTVVPMSSDIYSPVLNRLKKEGIFAVESSRPLD